MNNQTVTEKDKEEYVQWLKDTGRMKYEVTNVIINDNGNFRTEKKMAWVIKTTPKDWEEFCKVIGRVYEGSVNLLAIY